MPHSRAAALRSSRINDNESLSLRQTVPSGQRHLLHRPPAGSVHADHERSWPGRVVAARDVEQILTLLPAGNQRAVVVIGGVKRSGLRESENRRQADEQNDDGPSHRCRFHSTASGIAEILTSGTARIAISARA